MKHINYNTAFKFTALPFPAFRCKDKSCFLPLSSKLDVDENGKLIDGTFGLTKTRKGTTMVISGKDDSDSCLLFVGIKGKLKHASGKQLKKANLYSYDRFGDKVYKSHQYIFTMNSGDSLTYTDLYGDYVITLLWDGSSVKKSSITSECSKFNSVSNIGSMIDGILDKFVAAPMPVACHKGGMSK